MQLTPEFIAFALTAVAVVSVLLATRKHPVWGKSKGYLFTGLGVLEANICMAMAMLLTSPAPKLVFHELKFIGVAFLPVTSIFFYMDVFGVTAKRVKALAAALFTIPTITVIIALSNPLHHLFRTDLFTETIDGLVYVDTRLGPYFYIHSVYSYLAIFTALIFVLAHYLNTPSIYRSQRSVIVFSIVMILPVNVASLAGLVPDRGDLAVLAFAATYLTQSWALMRYKPHKMLRRERELVYNSMEDRVLFFGPDGALLDANAGAVSLFDIKPPLSLEEFAANALGIAAGEIERHKELTLPPPRSGVYTVTWKPISDADGRYCGHVLSLHDVTVMRRAIDELAYACGHDPLTKLYNRQSYRELLPELEAVPPPYSAISCSINNMKFANNVFGFEYGDKVIADTGALLAGEAGEDGVCVRLGGDEFLLLAAWDEARAASAIERMRDNAPRLSLSFGFVTKKAASQNLELLIPLAVEEMYREKLRTPKLPLIDILNSAITEAGFEEICSRVSKLCGDAGAELGLTQRERRNLILLSRYYLIGLLSWSYENGDRMPSEEALRLHPGKGSKIARMVPELIPVADMIYTQNAHYDGTGLPEGLQGEQIPVATRVLQVCAYYDKAVNINGKTPEFTRLALEAAAGTLYDPEAVRALLSVVVKA